MDKNNFNKFSKRLTRIGRQYVPHEMNSGAKPSCEQSQPVLQHNGPGFTVVNEDREQRRRQSINSFHAGHALQPAFVLHTRPYRDTSLLVELFTLHHGRLTVVARGARVVRSKFYGALLPFGSLVVSYSGKSELRTLQQAEISDARYNFDHNSLVSGLYLNELLIKLLPAHESYTEVYQAYQSTLAILAAKKQHLEIALRLFEKCFLTNLGYGLQLQYTQKGESIIPERFYDFIFGFGLSPSKTTSGFLGKNLLALHQGTLTTLDELRDAKRLLRGVLAILLGNKRIRSRELFFFA